jgi:hypothetical protein
MRKRLFATRGKNNITREDLMLWFCDWIDGKDPPQRSVLELELLQFPDLSGAKIRTVTLRIRVWGWGGGRGGAGGGGAGVKEVKNNIPNFDKEESDLIQWGGGRTILQERLSEFCLRGMSREQQGSESSRGQRAAGVREQQGSSQEGGREGYFANLFQVRSSGDLWRENIWTILS